MVALIHTSRQLAGISKQNQLCVSHAIHRQHDQSACHSRTRMIPPLSMLHILHTHEEQAISRMAGRQAGVYIELWKLVELSFFVSLVRVHLERSAVWLRSGDDTISCNTRRGYQVRRGKSTRPKTRAQQ